MKSIKNRSKINTCFRFILMGIIFAISFADPPDWEDNPGAYEFTATISGVIILKNGEQMKKMVIYLLRLTKRVMFEE